MITMAMGVMTTVQNLTAPSAAPTGNQPIPPQRACGRIQTGKSGSASKSECGNRSVLSASRR
jgi:hypothetical protein